MADEADEAEETLRKGFLPSRQQLTWWDAIAVGAITGGVNNPTLVALNAVLLALVLSLLFLFGVVWSYGNYVTLHVAILLVLAAGLIVLINWFVSEIGLVPSSQQASELVSLSRDATARQSTNGVKED